MAAAGTATPKDGPALQSHSTTSGHVDSEPVRSDTVNHLDEKTVTMVPPLPTFEKPKDITDDPTRKWPETHIIFFLP